MLLSLRKPGRSKRFISNVVLPHPDLYIINDLIRWGSKGYYNVFIPCEISSIFFIFIIFFPYIQMYCLMCRRVTETEIITTATSRNGKLIRRGQCTTCRNLRLNSSTVMLPVEVFLIRLSINSRLNYIYRDIILLGLVQNLTKDWMQMEFQRNGGCQTIELIMQRITTTFAIVNIVILKLGMMFEDKAMLNELDGIMNPTLRERIDKSIVGNLIKFISD